MSHIINHRFHIFLLIAVFPFLDISSESLTNESDSVMVERLLADGDTTTLYYARRLLDRPYVAHTLEVNDTERLVVNLRQLDCTTLVETVCALTMAAREGQRDYRSFCQQLQRLRYRRGRLDGYPSRLHYFRDVNIDFIGRFGLVYNCMRWYAGTSVILHSNSYHKPRFSTNNTFGSWNVYVGYNFLLKKKYRKS